MKIYKGILIAITLSAISGYLFTSKAYAWTFFNPESIKPKLTLPTWAIKCSTLKSIIDKRIDKYDEKKENHLETYTKLEDRLEEKIAKWKEAGYDVDKLEDDLAALKSKVDKFKSDYAKFIDELKDTQEFDCDSTESEFKAALLEAKTALKTVREDAADVRSYYQKTIRKDILDLRDQKPEED